MTIRMVNVYADKRAPRILYALLAERQPHQSISHKRMPTFSRHRAFVNSMPYKEWNLIYAGDKCIGCIYLTRRREVGISIFSKYRGHGYGKKAVRRMRAKWNGAVFANINPSNMDSVGFFKAMGFRPLQITYVSE